MVDNRYLVSLIMMKDENAISTLKWAESEQSHSYRCFPQPCHEKKALQSQLEKGKGKENLFGWRVKLWWGWGYAPSCLDKMNVWLILYYFWCFSVCIYDDLALDYASGSSKNDVTMMEQVSIVKRAKFIVRTKWTIPYMYYTKYHISGIFLCICN